MVNNFILPLVEMIHENCILHACCRLLSFFYSLRELNFEPKYYWDVYDLIIWLEFCKICVRIMHATRYSDGDTDLLPFRIDASCFRNTPKDKLIYRNFLQIGPSFDMWKTHQITERHYILACIGKGLHFATFRFIFLFNWYIIGVLFKLIYDFYVS